MPPTKKPRSDSLKNRKAVLDAAATVFAESGVEASIEFIAERSGVGVGTVYRHFPSKRALVEAVVAHRLNGLAEMMSGDLRIKERADLADFISSLAREYVLKHMLVDHLRRDEGGLDLYQLPELNGFLQALQSVVAEAHSRGVLRADVDRDDLLAVVIAAAESPKGDRLIALATTGLLPPH